MASPFSETWAGFTSAPELSSFTIESQDEGSESHTIKSDEKFDFETFPSVFNNMPHRMQSSRYERDAVNGGADRKNLRCHERAPLDLAGLEVPLFPSASSSLSGDLDLFRNQAIEAKEQEEPVELSFRPAASENFPLALSHLSDNLDVKNKKQNDYETFDKDPLGGWINQLIPEEPASPTIELPTLSLDSLAPATPPCTPPPKAIQLTRRRNRYDCHTNIHYQGAYNAIGNASCQRSTVGEHLSNEEWIAQRRIREVRQHRRRLERQREEERAGNGIQVIYQDEDFQTFALERLQQGDSLLMQQQEHPEQQRLRMEVLQTVAEQEEERSPRIQDGIYQRRQRRRHARRLPVTSEARRERLSHWSTAIVRASWRFLRAPFTAIGSRFPRNEQGLAASVNDDQHIDGMASGQNRNLEWTREMAFEGGLGWYFGQGDDDGSYDSADSSPSHGQSTAYWSTGTAMETDWDSLSDEGSSCESDNSQYKETAGIILDIGELGILQDPQDLFLPLPQEFNDI